MKRTFVLTTAFLFFIIACSKSSEDAGGNNSGGSGGGGNTNCNGVASKFAADVNPIIQANCATNASCHGSGSNNGPGPLLTYGQISNVKSNIKSSVSSGSMPKTGSLSAAQKNSIICWVDGGGLNN